jgi:hypothetical protein
VEQNPSDASAKVEGWFDGNEEVLLVIGDPKTPTDRKGAKELHWPVPVKMAGENTFQVRRETQKCLSRGYYLPPGFHYPDNLPEGHPGHYNRELPPYPVTIP